jgi:hypothetical protein
LEPILNSELILINNAKKLENDLDLLNEIHLPEIEELREKYVQLEGRTDIGEQGLQREKRETRDRLRDISSVTYTNRDRNLFGQMITTMTTKIVTRPQFSNYTFKDDMQSLAIEYILKYTWKFDPYRKSEITGQFISAFAYISTIIFNACIATINKFNKEQAKAKEDFLETQKLIHREPNESTITPEYELPKRHIKLISLEPEELYERLHSFTITEPTDFFIPKDYRISEKEYNFIMKYEHNISIRRIKDPQVAN